MRPLRKFRFGLIIVVSGVLWLCICLPAAPVNPRHQFLEVWNTTDETVQIATRALGEGFLLKVPPRERARFPDALEPGYQPLILFIGLRRVDTRGIQVNPYGNKTWLHGKRLSIWPKKPNEEEYSFENVLFLDGVWRMNLGDSKGVPQWYELDISHTKPHFSGSFIILNTGQKFLISGTMADQMINFKIAFPNSEMPDAQMEMSKLRVSPNGLMEGSFNASYVEEGERKRSSTPIRFEVDFEKKELVFKAYKN